MAPARTSFPNRSAAAAQNRERLLAAAREAFADPRATVSMAEVARRADVGMATLYRNFAGRLELLSALYDGEVDALCDAATVDDGRAPGDALIDWLRRLFAFIPSKRLVVSELLRHTDSDDPVIRGNRARALAAGEPLLAAAQASGEIRDDVTLEQVFDMVVAIARTDGDAAYVEPMLETMLDGLRRRD